MKSKSGGNNRGSIRTKDEMKHMRMMLMRMMNVVTIMIVGTAVSRSAALSTN